MRTLGEMLTECGGRLAPFERGRVGRAGCVVSLLALVGAGVALGTGWHAAGGAPASMRFLVLCGLAAVLALFLLYAAAETFVESSVRRRILAFSRESGNDLETLATAVEMRQGSIAGGRRLAVLLKELVRDDRGRSGTK